MPSLSAPLDAALAEADRQWPAQLDRLRDLVRIPSCSFPGYDHAEVARSALATADWLRAAGFPEVRVQDFPGALPYVVAHDRRAGPGAPTLLLYAHHDVQPPLRREVWTSDPFEPVERDGRLYGRGTADDKAGILVHAAAAAAWNAVAGRPPINLVVLIEGEEESGSKHMAAFLAAHREELACDALVIADLANVEIGSPSITTSLRGHVGAEVTLRALKSPLHSGMWGGAVPDVLQALCRLLATLTDADGMIAVPGLTAGVRPASAEERAGFARIPYDAARFAAQAGLPPGTAMPDAAALFDRLWRQPSLAINGIHAGTRGQVGNVIMDAAWSRLGVRIVPDQDPQAVFAALGAHLRANTPAGMTLEITPASLGAPWATATGHPLFAAARRALERGYGVAPIEIGCGASIPFVGAMTTLLGGVPAILVGVEDPACAAHAENESVHLGDLRSALRAQIALFAEAAG